MKANKEIRTKIFANGFRNWEVAEKLGMSDRRFCVWLRTEMRDDRRERVEKAIDKLVAERMRG